jgi:hypothetical protein
MAIRSLFINFCLLSSLFPNGFSVEVIDLADIVTPEAKPGELSNRYQKKH